MHKNQRRNLTIPSTPSNKTKKKCICIEDLNKEIHSDETRASLHTTRCGNRYIMVAIHLDANYIFAEPMKNQTEAEMIKKYQKIVDKMRVVGLGLKKHVINNE